MGLSLVWPGLWSPANALLRIHFDSDIRQFDESRWNPTDQIRLEEAYPSVPWRNIIDVKKSLGGILGRAVAQVFVGSVEKKTSAIAAAFRASWIEVVSSQLLSPFLGESL
jgi:hypothetical protein